MNRWVCLYPYLFLKSVFTIFSFEDFLMYLLPIQQMMCFLAAYHISSVAFFCRGIDKFPSIPIAHLLVEVMQIFGRVWFQLLLSCLWSSTPLKCKWHFPLQVCSTAKSRVTEVMLLHEKLQGSSLSLWRFSRFSYLQFFTRQVWSWIEDKQGAAVAYSGDFFKDSFVTLKLFCCTLEELPKAM